MWWSSDLGHQVKLIFGHARGQALVRTMGPVPVVMPHEVIFDVLSGRGQALVTKRWLPPQRVENGKWSVVPLTPGKSADKGQWVAACDGKYKYGFSEVLSLTMALPENYEMGRAWLNEMLNGPE